MFHLQQVLVSLLLTAKRRAKRTRTLARSKELEAEETNGVRRPVAQGGDFSDDPDEQATGAALLQDDQIDFFDRGEDGDGYQDEFTDDDDLNFGEGDEEEAISMNHQRPRR